MMHSKTTKYVISVAIVVASLGIGLMGYAVQNLPFFDTLGTNLSDSPTAKIEKTLKTIQRDYYDPARIHPREILESGMRAIAEKLPAVLITFSTASKHMRVDIHNKTRSYPYGNVVTLFDVVPLFTQIFQWIDEEKLLAREHISADDLEYAVCDAILSTLDPHSNVMTPEVFKEFQTQTEGEFGGIGIVIGLREGLLTVISPLAGTPAWRAGVVSGDRILKINGEPSLNMELNEAVNKLRGKVGTVVKIALQRESGDEYTTALEREVIQIESVQSTLIAENSKNIGYLRVKSFQGDTYDEILKHLQALKNRIPNASLDGLILDLRNNPGGLLDQAVEMADLFLDDGPVVMTVKTGGVVEKIRMAHAPGTEPKYPMIVFVNSGSASASEIVAAALKDNGRALVVGEQTFGKGSIQSIFDLGNEAAIKMTIAEYWTAGRRSIQSLGITPHIRLFPIKISKKLVDLIPNVRVGESDLEHHLENEQSEERKPLFQLSYFDALFFKDAAQKSDDENDEDDETKKAFSEQAKREYSKEAYIKDDYWVELAKKILLTEEQPLLNTNQSLDRWLRVVQREEDQKAARALTQLGIHWEKEKEDAAPTAPDVAALKLDTTFKQNGKVVTHLEAGQKAAIEVKATNLGKTPLYRVLASTRSTHQHFIFDDREFVFGRIDPGQSVVASTELKIPEAMPPFTEPIIYDIYSGAVDKIAESRAYYPVMTAEKPQFAFYYTFTDRMPNASSPLAANGAVDPGELIELKLLVRNQGKGAGEEVQVNLKNLSSNDISLENGRADLTLLKPQTEKPAILSFRVNPTTTEKEVSLSLLVSDNKSGEILDTRLLFPLAIKETITPSPGKWHRPPQVLISKVNALKNGSTGPLPFQVEGVLIDDEGLQDLQAFVGNDKQYLKASPQGQKSSAFSFVLSYDPKNKDRFFYLVGRDQEGLVEREIYGIPLFN